MQLFTFLSFAALGLRGAHSQQQQQSTRTTYSACRNETVSGNSVLYGCLGPGGTRTVFETYAAATAPVTTTAAESGQTTAVTGCHTQASATGVFCTNGAGSEVVVQATPTGEVPATYSGCHAHGPGELYCFTEEGEDVAVTAVGAEAPVAEGEGEEAEAAGGGESLHCHDHAGVPHCVGGGGASEERDCGMPDRDYNVGIRIGMIFVVLVTSGIGVFAPLILTKLPVNNNMLGNVLMIVKQFGTGIIISTAFIHLYSHAQLYLSNECINWPVYYEGTTSAIVMAGLFLSFLIDYIGHRIADSHNPRSSATTSSSSADDSNNSSNGNNDDNNNNNTKSAPQTADPSRNAFLLMDHHHGGDNNNNKLSVSLMEAGIIFHSIIIGLILVVTPDSSFRTLLAVVIFHQFFEGLALGARICLLPNTSMFPTKFLMAFLFTLITPIGMAIGIGVLDSFNGNDPGTMVAFGTLNAVSAGILIWVGVVDMWARDWVIEQGQLLHSGPVKTVASLVALMLGIILMSVLGKWA